MTLVSESRYTGVNSTLVLFLKDQQLKTPARLRAVQPDESYALWANMLLLMMVLLLLLLLLVVVVVMFLLLLLLLVL